MALSLVINLRNIEKQNLMCKKRRSVIFFLIISSLISCSTTKYSNETYDTISIDNFMDEDSAGNYFQVVFKALNYASENPGTSLFFPKGSYPISNLGESVYTFKIPPNTTLIGETGAEIYFEEKQSQGTRMFLLDSSSKNIVIQNLIFSGYNSSSFSEDEYSEHEHIMFLNSAENVLFYNCQFSSTAGDGIYIMGEEKPSTNVDIIKCQFSNHTRNGITLGNGFNGVNIDSCYFDAGSIHQIIDTEPFKQSICKDVIISNSHFINNNKLKVESCPLVTLGGFRIRVENYIIKGNVFENVGLHLVGAYGVRIIDNIIKTVGKTSGIRVIYESQDVDIERNVVYSHTEPIKIHATKISSPERITIKHNDLISRAIDLSNIVLYGVSDVLVEGNRMFATMENNSVAFSIRATDIMHNIFINSNTIFNYSRGFDLKNYKDNKLKNLSAVDNTFYINKNQFQLYQIYSDKEFYDFEFINNVEKKLKHDYYTRLRLR